VTRGVGLFQHLRDGRASRYPCDTRRPPRQNRYNVGKTYLLFQEFYGHAGVENRGRNFGPAPWLARALDVPPACQKRRLGSTGLVARAVAPRLARAWPRVDSFLWVWAAPHTQR
jgi:hypothetical protein